jgi:hypothetical protein
MHSCSAKRFRFLRFRFYNTCLMTFLCQRCGDGGQDSVRGSSPEEGGEAAGAQEKVRDAQARAPQQVDKEIFNIL